MNTKQIVILLFLVTLVAACMPAANENEEVSSIWVDKPLENSNVPVGLVWMQVSLTTSWGAGVLPDIDLYVNGDHLASVSPVQIVNNNDGYRYFGYEYNWEAEVPGIYLLEARYGDLTETAQFLVVGPADEGPDQIVPPQSEETTFTVLPYADSNCRYACSSSNSDVADTLLEGAIYSPLGVDYGNGWFLFSGPSFGEQCWVHESLLDLQISEESVDLDAVSASGLVEEYACPVLPTATAAADASSPSTATSTSAPPQCNDGIDNDGDGRADYYPPAAVLPPGRGDAQCSDANDNDESS